MPINNAHRYLEMEIKTATPTELVVVLYDGAIADLQKAQEHLAARDIAGRACCLNRAMAILTELQANLNFEAGGEIALSLDRLYRYLKDRIFQANLHQDAAPLKEAASLLCNLRGGWEEVAEAEGGRSPHAKTPHSRTSPPAAALSLAAEGAPASAGAGFNVTG